MLTLHRWRQLILLVRLVCLSLALMLIGCTTPNHAFRPNCEKCFKQTNAHGKIERDVHPCEESKSKSCDQEYIVKKPEGYHLAFVEFTERGNLFSRDNFSNVLSFIKEEAEKSNEEGRSSGVNVVIYVHGWHHNASKDSKNLEEFNKSLRIASELSRKRKLIGVYIGWRGKAFTNEYLDYISYYDRKDVAHEVGKGGVTEFLLRLERILKNKTGTDSNPNKNQLLIVGHSMGSLVLLSSLNEILLERIIEKGPDNLSTSEEESSPCIVTEPFAHGVVLLNSAIEANEILQLKELVSSTDFCNGQDRFMHILSSEADEATTSLFEWAQYFGIVLTNKHIELDRDIGSNDIRNISLKETDLSSVALGNYEPFWTGIFRWIEDEEGDTAPNQDNGNLRQGKWHYQDLEEKKNIYALPDKYEEHHVRVKPNDPLAFISTDKHFIEDHNDIFNDNVAPYLLAIMAEARQARALKKVLASEGERDDDISKYTDGGDPERCRSNFDFGECFESYQEVWCQTKADLQQEQSERCRIFFNNRKL